jgi:hypothetical protein
MVDGIHSCSPHVGPTAHPALAAGFADGYILVVRIADFTNGCPAIQMNPADL